MVLIVSDASNVPAGGADTGGPRDLGGGGNHDDL